MDNAIRFDETQMLRNGMSAFSANQESIDLNALLYGEKLALASLADMLDMGSVAARLREEAASLQHALQVNIFMLGGLHKNRDRVLWVDVRV